MRIEWAIPCESVTVGDDDHVSAIHNFGFDAVLVRSVPAEVDFVVVCRFVGRPEDFTEEVDRNVEVVLTGPGTEVLMEKTLEVRPGEASPDHPEGWEIYTVVPLLIEFTAHVEGAYVLDFYVSGRLQRCSIPLLVRVSAR
jgi:hypothetical protein